MSVKTSSASVSTIDSTSKLGRVERLPGTPCDAVSELLSGSPSFQPPAFPPAIPAHKGHAKTGSSRSLKTALCTDIGTLSFLERSRAASPCARKEEPPRSGMFATRNSRP
jgi:hypothetical protein